MAVRRSLHAKAEGGPHIPAYVPANPTHPVGSALSRTNQEIASGVPLLLCSPHALNPACTPRPDWHCGCGSGAPAVDAQDSAASARGRARQQRTAAEWVEERCARELARVG